jgi:hypothetical protein
MPKSGMAGCVVVLLLDKSYFSSFYSSRQAIPAPFVTNTLIMPLNCFAALVDIFPLLKWKICQEKSFICLTVLENESPKLGSCIQLASYGF